MTIRPESPVAPPAGFLADPIVEDASTKVIDKGSQFQHTTSKSTFNKAVGFCPEDQCGNKYYSKIQVSSTVNQLTEDCELIPGVLTGSLNVTIARIATEAEIDTFIGTLGTAIKAKFTELGPAPTP